MRALTLATGLVACAPTEQKPLTGAIDFDVPRIDGNSLISSDGARLALKVWPAKGETKFVLAGLHGMNDYSGSYRQLGPYLAERGVTVYALDQRGFGASPNPGIWPGEKLMLEDTAAFVAAIRYHNPGKPVALMGISMGGAVAIRAVASGKVAPDRLILAAPAVWGWSAMPRSYRAALWMAAHTRPNQIVTPPKGLKIVASDNNKFLWENWNDPLFIKKTRIAAIYGLVKLMEGASDSVGSLPTSTLYLYGAKDQVIPPKATFRAVRKLPPTVKSIYYPAGYHMLTSDLQAPTVWGDILSFIHDVNAPPPSGLGPIPRAAPKMAPTRPATTSSSTRSGQVAQGNP